MATITPAPKQHIPTWTLADRMGKARKDAGLSPAEIADTIGISRKSVWNYENGVTHPLTPILRAWAEVTGVPIEWLEDGESPFPGGMRGTFGNRTGQLATLCSVTQSDWSLAA